MSTPILQQQNFAFNILNDAPWSFDIAINAADGTPIDASTGWTVQSFRAKVSASANPMYTGLDLKTQGTYTFGIGKLTWSGTSAQAQAMSFVLASLVETAVITLSNDASATVSRLGSGTVSYDLGLGF